MNEKERVERMDADTLVARKKLERNKMIQEQNKKTRKNQDMEKG